jgi:hypothetical protein
LIYFCNIHTKHLQRTFETSEHLNHMLATCTFSALQHLAAWENEARQCVEFTGGSGLTALVGGPPAAVAT